MKKWYVLLILMGGFQIASAQSLPFDFETSPTTGDFVDFDGGVANVVANPYPDPENNSSMVGQIIRNGGQVWAGSKIILSAPLDFSTNSSIEMKLYTSAPVGTVVKIKLEYGTGAFAEVDQLTTMTNAWETLSWDFTGTPSQFNELVFMFDFGNLGDGTSTSTFYFDDVDQVFSGAQIDLPVDFEGNSVNYTMTDFGGNFSQRESDFSDPSNNLVRVTKPMGAASWAGTTIGTPSGFATDIPLSLTESVMSVRVWSPTSGTPIRLKVEDSDDPTHTCETEVNTTIAMGWETLYFDFSNEAPGTSALSFGLANGWTYNMASIFFNFGTDGNTAGETTYYFDDVVFGSVGLSQEQYFSGSTLAFPNPTRSHWTLSSEHTINNVRAFEMGGRQMGEWIISDEQFSIPSEAWPEGIYLISIETAGGIEVLRLVKH